MSDVTPAVPTRKPKWLRVKLPTGENYKHVRSLVDQYKLHTICESGHCPNMGECWGEGHGHVHDFGNICTRSCGFCNVATGRPLPVDWDEPDRVGRSIKLMKVKHAVLTSVDRDDLPDGGSILWAETIKAVRRISPGTTMETLIPDFRGNERQLNRVLEAAPEVISHNMETVRRLTSASPDPSPIRPQLGGAQVPQGPRGPPHENRDHAGPWRETVEEVRAALHELREARVDVVTLGQYLQPTPKHLPRPSISSNPRFSTSLGHEAKALGFIHVESGPLVRSSYHAEKHIL